MGNIISALVCLYCRSGCKASVVTSALTFHPPDPPYYDFSVADGKEGKGNGEAGGGEYADEATEPMKDSSAADSAGSGVAKAGAAAAVAGPRETVFSAELPNMPKHMLELHTAHMLVSANGTFVPVHLWTYPKAKHTVIVSHGNAADLGSMFYFNCLLNTELRVNVVAYDYTGYGASANLGTRPTEEQTYGDIECVYDWACTHQDGLLIGGPNGDPEKAIIVYGQSVGSGPSCFLASNTSMRVVQAQEQRAIQARVDSTLAERAAMPVAEEAPAGSSGGYPNVGSSGSNAANVPPPPPYAPIMEGGSCMRLTCLKTYTRRKVAGLVLHSPIMSGLRVLTQNRCLACCDIYPNIDLVTSVSSPVFVIHGNRDQEVPFMHGQRLQEAVPPQHRTPPWWVADRGHNDVLIDNEDEFFTRMKKFLAVIKLRQREKDAAAAAAALGGSTSTSSKKNVVPVAVTRPASSSNNKADNSYSAAGNDADVAAPFEVSSGNSSNSPGRISVTLAPEQERDYSQMAIQAAQHK